MVDMLIMTAKANFCNPMRAENWHAGTDLPKALRRQPNWHAFLGKIKRPAAPDKIYERGPMHYLLFYDVSPDYLVRRADFRNEHLLLAWEAQERGELVLGGALADPVDGAVLLFKAESAEAVERFVAADPYVKNGLILNWRIRPWTTVVGADAASPVRPGG
jgi:uncharacterized protein YciI